MDLNTCTCMRTQKAETLSKETTMNIAGVTVKEQSEMIHNNGYNTPLIWTTLICINHYTSTSTVVVQFFFCIQYFRKSAPACQIKIEETIREQRSSFKNQLVRDKVFIGIKSTLRSCFPSYVYLMKHWKRSFINSINTKRWRLLQYIPSFV